MTKTQEIAEFYSREADQYDATRWRSSAGRYTDKVQKEIVEQLCGDLTGYRVLEVGAGAGRFTSRLVDKGAQVTAIDISLPMLGRLRKALATGCSLAQADACFLPFAADRFDLCLSVNVFSHVADCSRMLREIARGLKPGGCLVVNFPNLWSYYLPAGLFVNLRGRAVNRDVYTRWYTLRFFTAACNQAGLFVEQAIGQVHLPEHAGTGLSAILRYLDKLSRKSPARYLCPILFLRVVKKNR